MINISELKKFEGKDIKMYMSGLCTVGKPYELHNCEIIENENNNLYFLSQDDEEEEAKISKNNIKSIENTYIENQLIIHLLGGLDLFIKVA